MLRADGRVWLRKRVGLETAEEQDAGQEQAGWAPRGAVGCAATGARRLGGEPRGVSSPGSLARLVVGLADDLPLAVNPNQVEEIDEVAAQEARFHQGCCGHIPDHFNRLDLGVVVLG